jgi:hypothetical protein
MFRHSHEKEPVIKFVIESLNLTNLDDKSELG